MPDRRIDADLRLHQVRPSLAMCMMIVGFAGFLLIGEPSSASTGFSVGHLNHRPETLIPGEGRVFDVRFTLSEPARVFLEIYDDRDLLVAEVDSGGLLESGDQSLSWDGRDLRGRIVPPNAYQYILAGSDQAGLERNRHLPPEDSVRSRTKWIDVAWDATSGELTYRLDVPSRVRIRVGLSRNGPLLKTLHDWVPRTRGGHSDRWDGFDASRAMNFSNHPNLKFTARAFGLPRNTLIVEGSARSDQYITDLPEPVRRLDRGDSNSFRMFDYARQSGSQRGDIEVALEIGLPKDEDSESERRRVAGAVPVRVTTSSKDAERLLNERFEAVYFVDGRMVFETEVGFLPITWRWDTSSAVPGEHLLTVNLRGFDGHFGLASKIVNVVRESSGTN